jgi:hypothetical protein
MMTNIKTKHFKFICFTLLIVGYFTGFSQAPTHYSSSIPIKTGYNYELGSTYGNSADDHYWTILHQEGNTVKETIVKKHSAWYSGLSQSSAKWIQTGGTTKGFYTYRIAICITGYSQKIRPSISITYSVDNVVDKLSIDGEELLDFPKKCSVHYKNVGFWCAPTATRNISLADLPIGYHILEFQVYNIGYVTGLLIDGHISGVNGWVLSTDEIASSEITGCSPKGQIRGIVVDDEHICHERDPGTKGDIPKEGVPVNLMDANGNIIQSILSDEFGAYNFYNVDVDQSYKVSLPDEENQSFPHDNYKAVPYDVTPENFVTGNGIFVGDFGFFKEDNACLLICEQFENQTVGMPLGHGMAVATRKGLNNNAPVVQVFDVRSPAENGGAHDGVHDWNAGKWAHPDWDLGGLGQVFGICLDNADNPNIYVTASSSYSSSSSGPSGRGAVYKLDGSTGAVSTFALLPVSNSNAGLGNICFDEKNNQFFVSSFEDGKIYTIKLDGTIKSAVYDPFTSDNSAGSSFAPLGERVWGVAVNNNKLFFSVWSEDEGRKSTNEDRNAIYSVDLGSTGDIAGVATLELNTPDLIGDYTNPVADISFAADGRMLLTERSMISDFTPGTGNARALEYQLSGSSYQLLDAYPVGNTANHQNSTGGGAYSPDGSVWLTGDALTSVNDNISGLQWLPAGQYHNTTIGDQEALSQSFYVDYDHKAGAHDSQKNGDIEVYHQKSHCNDDADFVFAINCLTNEVTFSVKNPSGDNTYSWNFGDGTTGVGKNVSHVYDEATDYSVQLVTKGTCDCGSENTVDISFVLCEKCIECIPSFSPEPGHKYTLSAWVKEDVVGVANYENAYIELDFRDANTIGPIKATGNIIDGWQRIEFSFVVPNTATDITVRLKNAGSGNVFFDDIRIHPFNSNMKSFVYDPLTLRLQAELDENNYATIYEYDEEGALVRVKKETERGVKTINETRQNLSKQLAP